RPVRPPGDPAPIEPHGDPLRPKGALQECDPFEIMARVADEHLRGRSAGGDGHGYDVPSLSRGPIEPQGGRYPEASNAAPPDHDGYYSATRLPSSIRSLAVPGARNTGSPSCRPTPSRRD